MRVEALIGDGEFIKRHSNKVSRYICAVAKRIREYPRLRQTLRQLGLFFQLPNFLKRFANSIL
jgi:hypothetical protein